MHYGYFIRKKKPQRIDKVERGSIGLDIGTSNIVLYKMGKSEPSVQIEPNVFLTVPSLPQTKKILSGTDIPFLEKEGSLYILGNRAQEFAGIMREQTKQPMKSGMLNLGEDEGIDVIQAILNRLVGPPKKENEPLWFSVPAKSPSYWICQEVELPAFARMKFTDPSRTW